MTVDELFETASEWGADSRPLVGLNRVAAVLGIRLAGAREWAWATGIPQVDGRILITRAQAVELAADPDGRRALHEEVVRLRAEVRMHRLSAKRREEARAQNAARREKQTEELAKLAKLKKGRTL